MTSPVSATTVVHCSDLHYGHGFIPPRAEQLLERINEVRPDAVIVSGDLTMRARASQFAQARDFLKRIEAPLMIIPGNHDVPLYNVLRRATNPFGNYRRFTDDLSTNPILLPHVGFLGINTVNPMRHQQGIVRPHDLLKSIDWMESLSADLWRVIVVHQHFANVPGMQRPGAMPNADDILQKWSAAGGHAVLHGHTHYSRVTTAQEFFPSIARKLALVSVGTATSERTRGEDRTNSYNVLQFTAEKFIVRQCNWDPVTRHFTELRQYAFERQMFETIGKADA